MLWLLNSAYNSVAFLYWPLDESTWHHCYLNECIVQHGRPYEITESWNGNVSVGLLYRSAYIATKFCCLSSCAHAIHSQTDNFVHSVEIFMVTSFFFPFRSLLRTLMVLAAKCGYWAHRWRVTLLPRRPPRTHPRQRNGCTSDSSSRSRWSRPFQAINNWRPIKSSLRPLLKRGREERKISHVSWVPRASRHRRSTAATRRAAPSPKARIRVPRAHGLWQPPSPNKRLRLGKTAVKFSPCWHLIFWFVWLEREGMSRAGVGCLTWSAWVFCVMGLIFLVLQRSSLW